MLAAPESFQLGGKNPGPDRLRIVVGVIAWFRKLSRLVSQMDSRLWITSELPVRTKPLVRRRESSGVADEEWKR